MSETQAAVPAADSSDRDEAARAKLARLVPADPLARRRGMQALLRVVANGGGQQ